MEDENRDEQILAEWSYRKPIFDSICTYLKNRTNMLIYGCHSIGKTKLIQDCFQFLKIEKYYIDCHLHQTENSICKCIFRKTKLNNFSELDNIDKYIILDSIELLSKSKIMSKILKFLEDKKCTFILIMTGLPNESIEKADDLNCVHVLVNNFSLDELKMLFCLKLKNYNPKIMEKFIDILYKNFSQYTSSINEYTFLAESLIDDYYSSFSSYLNVTETDFVKAYSKDFQKKLLKYLNRIYWHFKYTETEEEKEIESKVEIDQFSLEKNKRISKRGLNIIQALLVISGYIAANNPKATDSDNFAYNPSNRKRKKVQFESIYDPAWMKSKKFNISRWNAIADYLFSLHQDEFENGLNFHSNYYYSCINDLISLLYFDKHNSVNKDSFNPQFTCNIDIFQINEISELFDIKAFQYIVGSKIKKNKS